MQPDFPVARTGRAFARLTAGRLAEAWADYEARTAASAEAVHNGPSFDLDPDRIPGAAWSGEPRDGRSLLIYNEQGLGDVIQMARYASLLAHDGPVSWIVLPALRPLMSGLPGSIEILVAGDDLPPHSLKCPVMSLPRMFRTTLETIPADVPYLRADPDRIALWRSRLRGVEGLKVGLTWKGNPEYPFDRLRSVPSEALSALDGIPGVTFVSLQLPRPIDPPPLEMLDLTADIADFADTAALTEALDLIVSVDTSVAHLAGALGRPVWLLNRFSTDWRWLLNRSDSPWYPTMRIFRQATQGDWAGVLAMVRTALMDARA
jgi:hypothetical protein